MPKALKYPAEPVERRMAKFSSSDESLYRLLELINSYTPLLDHYSAASVHPFELFKLLTMFSAE